MTGPISKLLHLPLDLWLLAISHWPGPLGFILRRWYWRRRLLSLGKHTRIDVGAHFQGAEFISIGEHCWIDRNVIILAGPPGGERVTLMKENPNFTPALGEVVIGDQTHIAPNSVLSGIGGIQIGQACTVASGSAVYSFSHHYRNLTDKSDRQQYAFTSMARPDQQAMILGPVVIQDYCAVGLNSVVLPGVTMHRGSWLASGSVLSQDLPAQTLAYEQRQTQRKSLQDLEIRT